MSNIETIVDDLEVLQDGYQPSAETAAGLSQHDLVMIVGPFVAGKTSITESAEQLSPDFGRIVGFTTRPRRKGEDAGTYNYIPHDEENLGLLRSRAIAGEIIQFVVHPTTKKIYGVGAESFGRRYMMLDALPSSVDRYASMPFNNSHQIAVTVPPPLWQARFKLRAMAGNLSAEDAQARLEEGIANISWCLDQGDDIKWVINGRRNVSTTARQVMRIVKGEPDVSVPGRLVADRLRTTMSQMLSKR